MVMKTLKHERYVAKKSSKFTTLKVCTINFIIIILHAHTIPTCSVYDIAAIIDQPNQGYSVSTTHCLP